MKMRSDTTVNANRIHEAVFSPKQYRYFAGSQCFILFLLWHFELSYFGIALAILAGALFCRHAMHALISQFLIAGLCTLGLTAYSDFFYSDFYTSARLSSILLAGMQPFFSNFAIGSGSSSLASIPIYIVILCVGGLPAAVAAMSGFYFKQFVRLENRV